jgi:hypothetical protein
MIDDQIDLAPEDIEKDAQDTSICKKPIEK